MLLRVLYFRRPKMSRNSRPKAGIYDGLVKRIDTGWVFSKSRVFSNGWIEFDTNEDYEKAYH